MTYLNSYGNQVLPGRVVLLGATGFIGRWVARILSALNTDLYLFVRDEARAKSVFSRYEVHGEIIQLDLDDFSYVKSILREIQPTITFNLAGYGVDKSENDETTAYQINAELVRAIIDGIRETQDSGWQGQAIVHVGSALEYGEIGGDLSEDSQPNPTTLYGKSKLAGTNYLKKGCQSHGIRGLTARLFTVYGPGEHEGRLLPTLFETAANSAPLKLTAGSQHRDFTYVEDVAEGLLRLGLTESEPGAIVNLATGKLNSVRSFVETAAGVLNIPSELLQFGAIPTHNWEMRHDPVSIEHLKCLTEWKPTIGIAEGIRNTKAFNNNRSEGGNEINGR